MNSMIFLIFLAFVYKTNAGFNYGKCLESPIYPGFDTNQVNYHSLINIYFYGLFYFKVSRSMV
jgi:hypothetical protein